MLAVADRVAQLNAAYARAIDDDRLEQWPALFTDPCLYKITSAEHRCTPSLLSRYYGQYYYGGRYGQSYGQGYATGSRRHESKE